MKKYKVIYRDKIIDLDKKKIYDDIGLKALNGYYEFIFRRNHYISI